jgi:small-conductance mechanosensitive channel
VTPDHRRGIARRNRVFATLVVLGLMATVSWGAAQGTPAVQTPEPAVAQPVTAVVGIEPSGQSATVMFSNRPIAVLRARVLGRMPAERAASSERLLHELAAQRISGPVEVRVIEGSRAVTVAARTVLVLTPVDLDDVTGETLDETTARAVSVLNLALAEALEARRPAALLRSAAMSVLALAVAAFLLFVLARGHRRIGRWLIQTAEDKLARSGTGPLEVLRASRVFEFWRSFVSLVSIALSLFVVYSAVTFILRRFPYTRPWGESMRAFMLDSLSRLGLDMVHAVPALFTVIVIFLIARFFIRVLQLFFKAIEQGRVEVKWLHPETAQPTRRLMTLLLWIFALVMAYPYLPGSSTDAFKGASVFIGLVLSLGSSGLVNQIMSSFMITYSRALRLNDYVDVGHVEGTVTQVGVLSTKIKTPRGEEVTIPNAVVVAATTTNYSRFATDGVYMSTSVTIGYDTPWRQVQSMLLIAAARTAGVRQTPEPKVRQAELQDFYVKYTLLVCAEQPERRHSTLSTLHEHILDVFNEYGVQITSPNYETDPEGLKVVPKDRWYAAPAREEK